jgi:hypothetical protein
MQMHVNIKWILFEKIKFCRKSSEELTKKLFRSTSSGNIVPFNIFYTHSSKFAEKRKLRKK